MLDVVKLNGNILCFFVLFFFASLAVSLVSVCVISVLSMRLQALVGTCEGWIGVRTLESHLWMRLATVIRINVPKSLLTCS